MLRNLTAYCLSLPALLMNAGTALAAADAPAATDHSTSMPADAATLAAQVLDAEALTQAARIINGRIASVDAPPGRNTLVVLGEDDPLPLERLFVLRHDLASWDTFVSAARCNRPARSSQAGRGTLGFDDYSASLGAVKAAIEGVESIVGASQVYTAVPLTLSHALISNAIGMRDTATVASRVASWTSVSVDSSDHHTTWAYRLLSEARFSSEALSHSPAADTIAGAYARLVDHVRRKEVECQNAGITTNPVAAVDTYIANLNKAEGTSPSPLEQALRIEAMVRPASGGADVIPMVPRVHVEHAGGVSRVRSNLFYRLGFPGAATVSAGLLVSYRLVDPTNGQTSVAGLIRCMSPFRNVGSVPRLIARGGSNVACSYVTS